MVEIDWFQTTNLVEWLKLLGGVSPAAGVLNEGIVNSSWEDREGVMGEAASEMSPEVGIRFQSGQTLGMGRKTLQEARTV